MATCKAYLLWFKSFDSLLRILIGFTNLYWFLSANNHQRFASRGYNLRSKESLPIYTPQYLVKESLVGKPPCAPHDRIRRIRGSYLKSFQVLRGLLGQDLQHSTNCVNSQFCRAGQKHHVSFVTAVYLSRACSASQNSLS